jgi:hypothetical protein
MKHLSAVAAWRRDYRALGPALWKRPNNGSRMMREYHVRQGLRMQNSIRFSVPVDGLAAGMHGGGRVLNATNSGPSGGGLSGSIRSSGVMLVGADASSASCASATRNRSRRTRSAANRRSSGRTSPISRTVRPCFHHRPDLGEAISACDTNHPGFRLSPARWRYS